MEQQKKRIDLSDDLLTETIEKYQSLYKRLLADKNKIIYEAEAKAAKILDSSNQLIEQTIKTIKEEQADKQKTKAARLKLDEEKSRLQKASKTKETPDIHQQLNRELDAHTEAKNLKKNPLF